jgi:divalent anion:Na+ symporter, DASS family
MFLFDSKMRRIALSFAAGLLIWFVPVPDGVDLKAWHLLAVFVFTLTLVISNALSMGASTLLGLTAAVATKTLTFQMAFGGYSNEVVWLVLTAFFISQGFILTGLGRRIAYLFMGLLGKKSVGLGYGVVLSELVLAPVIPSVTARSGAILYPIIKSLSHNFHSRVEDGTAKKLGTYLVLVVFHAAAITSAMFLTAMAANPMAADLAKYAKVQITWNNWALFAIVPGLVCLLLLPILLFWLSPPEIKNTPDALLMATAKLKEMGPMSKNEWLMLFTFLGLLFLWIFGSVLQIKATTAALLGLAFLMLVGVIQWKDLLSLTSAWDTFIWFGAFVAMAEGLNYWGITKWFGTWVAQGLGNMPWSLSFIILLLIYFYAHYFFASSTAHVGALYLPFLLVALNLGAPPLMTALLFGYASNLFGGLTHYGFGSAPILFGSGFVSFQEWWRIGFIVSSVNLLIWISVGLFWWNWLLAM